MSEMPEISVVIPNYNYGKWVGEAMRSVDGQDYSKKKIIILDDCSTDNSWAVISMLCGLKDASPNIIRKKNVAYTGQIGNTPVIAYRFQDSGGPARARNLGIKLGWPSTDIFAFLDADDVFLSGKLSKSVEKIMCDPRNVGAVYTDYFAVNQETGREIREYKEPYSRERLLQECVVHSACVVSKMAIGKVWENNSFYDESLRVCEDFDCWLRLSENFMIYHIPEALMRVKVGSHNSTATVPSETWQKCWARVAEKTRERMRRPNG